MLYVKSMGYSGDQNTKVDILRMLVMNKIIIFIVITGCIIMIGCKANEPEGETHGMLSIQNLNVSDQKLEFDYKIKNSYPMPIWVCVDVEAYEDEIQVSTVISKEKGVISLKSFDVPMHILLESPIWTKYARITSGSTFEGRISLILPLSNMSPLNFSGENSISLNLINIEQIVFEVGFFKGDLASKVSASVELDKSGHIAHISHLWEERNKALVATSNLVGKEIPCYIPKEQ